MNRLRASARARQDHQPRRSPLTHHVQDIPLANLWLVKDGLDGEPPSAPKPGCPLPEHSPQPQEQPHGQLNSGI